MKQLLFSILLIFAQSYTIFAQKLLWGEESKHLESSFIWHKYTYLTADEFGVYMLQLKGEKTYMVQQFDARMNLKKGSELSVLSKYKGVTRTFLEVFELGEELYMMSRAKDTPNKICYYLLEKFDKNTLKFIEIKEFYNMYYERLASTDYSFLLRLSPNKKKLLTLFYTKNKDKVIADYTIKVYHQDLKKDWEASIKLPNTEAYKSYTRGKVLFDNNDNIFIKGSIDMLDKTTFPTWKNELLAIYKKGKNKVFYPLGQKIGKIGVNRTELLLAKENEIVISGFTYKEKSDGFLGHYYLKINTESQEVEVEKYSNFDNKDFKLALNGVFEDPTLDSSKLVRDIYFGNAYSSLAELSDNGVLYRIKRYFKIITSNEGTETYKLEDMYIFKLNILGEIEWIRKIPMSGSSFYFAHYLNDKLYLVYNDNIGNQDFGPRDRLLPIPSPKRMKKGCLVATVLAPNGESKRLQISSYQEDNVLGGVRDYFFPNKDSNQVILLGLDSKQKKRYLGKLQLDESP